MMTISVKLKFHRNEDSNRFWISKSATWILLETPKIALDFIPIKWKLSMLTKDWRNKQRKSLDLDRSQSQRRSKSNPRLILFENLRRNKSNRKMKVQIPDDQLILETQIMKVTLESRLLTKLHKMIWQIPESHLPYH